MDVPRRIAAPLEAGGLDEVRRENIRDLFMMQYGSQVHGPRGEKAAACIH